MFNFQNFDDINVDDEFDALSTGMDEEEEGADNDMEDVLAGIKKLEDEIDEEEKEKTEGLHATSDAWKADYSQQPEQASMPASQPQQTSMPASQPQPIQMQPPQPLPPQSPVPIPQQPQPQAPIQPQQPIMPKPQQPQPSIQQQQKQQPPQKAQPPQSPQKQATQQPQQQKPQQQKPQQQQQKPAPKPKPKPAPPPDFVNDKSNSAEYNELFETFADTFYSMLHSKSNQKTYLEQIEKILPMVINGPSEPIKQDLDLSRPKLKAPSYRSYDDFKKKSISTASNPKEIEKIIKEIEEQIETLKKDAKLLLSLKCKNFAAYIIGQMKALKLSIIKLREEPYYISDVFRYYIPDVNAEVPLNVIRIKIISGSDFPKNDIIVAILLPIKGQGFYRVNTPCVKGPNPNFNYQVDIPLGSLRDPMAFKRFQTEFSSIGIYLNVGKEIPKDAEPKAIATIKTNFLFRHHALSCPAITFEDLPGALLHVECLTHHALAQPEMKPVEMRIKCSPFVSFTKKTKKAAAAEASQKGSINMAANQTSQAKKQETANSATRKVQNPPQKAEMRSQEEIKNKQKTPVVYVFTPEEQKMFWPGSLVMFVLDACKKVEAISHKKGEPVQAGLEQMIQTLETNWKKIEEAIGNEQMSQEQYMQMIDQAIKREQTRLPSIPANDKETHEGFINIMKSELDQCKKQMEEEED